LPSSNIECEISRERIASTSKNYSLGQAKFAFGGLVLGLSQFYLLPLLPQKSNT